MMIIIIGLILFSITLFIHKHTYVKEFEIIYKGYNVRYICKGSHKIKCPLRFVLLSFILSIIPFINIIWFIVEIISYIVELLDKDPYGTPKYYLKCPIFYKIIDFLNKEI